MMKKNEPAQILICLEEGAFADSGKEWIVEMWTI